MGVASTVTKRFLRHFFPIIMSPFAASTLVHIFQTILDWHFSSQPFPSSVRALSAPIVNATGILYANAVQTLLPIPRKSHYTFNLRDFSRVIQGVKLSN